jgi:hypothetical protein
MNVPDWLWQGLLENAIWAAIAFSAGWAWKNSADIRERLNTIRTPPKPTLTAGSQRQLLYDVRANVGSERQILYNVEAPKPSLARRLEDLAAWYLHVS